PCRAVARRVGHTMEIQARVVAPNAPLPGPAPRDRHILEVQRLGPAGLMHDDRSHPSFLSTPPPPRAGARAPPALAAPPGRGRGNSEFEFEFEFEAVLFPGPSKFELLRREYAHAHGNSTPDARARGSPALARVAGRTRKGSPPPPPGAREERGGREPHPSPMTRAISEGGIVPHFNSRSWNTPRRNAVPARSR